MISDQLRERDCIVVNAHGDADVEIVKTVVETSLQYDAGEDADILVLLLYYPQGEVMNLYFRSDKPKADGTIALYHINRIQEVLGHEMCSQLMFVHAMTGSDTTSRIFGVGKKTAFQYLAKGDPCPSVMCHRIHNPEPANIAYRKPRMSSNGCPFLRQGHIFTFDNAV